MFDFKMKFLKSELKRAFFNSGMLISLFIGIAIIATHIYMYVIPATKMLELVVKGDMYYPVVVFSTWIGAGTYSLQSYIYYILLPILAILPFGWSYYEERHNGHIKNVFIRQERKHYYTYKIIATFISGGTAFIIPLIINLLITAALLPSLIPQPGLTSVYSETCTMAGIFYSNPYLYIIIYFLLNFIFAGLFALLAIVVSGYVQHKFTIYIIPFIIYLFSYSLCSYLDLNQYATIYFLNPGYSASKGLSFCFSFISMIIIVMIFYFGKGRSEDVY